MERGDKVIFIGKEKDGLVYGKPYVILFKLLNYRETVKDEITGLYKQIKETEKNNNWAISASLDSPTYIHVNITEITTIDKFRQKRIQLINEDI